MLPRRKVALTLTAEAFSALHQVLDSAKRAKVVRVDRQALADLLMDHGRLLRLHEGRIEA
ncbi:MAG: hypothetical protein ACRDHG_04635 [Anaerolineales bacterium]